MCNLIGVLKKLQCLVKIPIYARFFFQNFIRYLSCYSTIASLQYIHSWPISQCVLYLKCSYWNGNVGQLILDLDGLFRSVHIGQFIYRLYVTFLFKTYRLVYMHISKSRDPAAQIFFITHFINLSKSSLKLTYSISWNVVNLQRCVSYNRTDD